MPKIFESGVDQNQQDQILLLHNQHRDMVMQGTVPKQPKGKNLTVLTWDDALAKEAQTLANTCEYTHKEVKDSRFPVGQNLYQSMSSNQVEGPDWNKAVTTWYKEHENYTYGTKYPGNVGHYTQLIWGSTNCVGCGWVHFEGKNAKMKFQKLYVCNYGPAGNITGKEPYEKA